MAFIDSIQFSRISACIVAAAIFLTPGCQSQVRVYPVASSCGLDDKLPARDLEAVDQAALQFVRAALGPDPTSAYSAYTAEAKKSIGVENFANLFQQIVKPMGPFRNLHVTHTYIAKVTGGEQVQRVVCGNLSSPGGWVAVNAMSGSSQAHVIVEGRTVNNTMAFVMWLAQEQGNWRLQYFHLATVTMVDKSAEDLQTMAALEEQRQHHFNAYVLYAAALQLADRGPNFQLGIRPEIQKGMEQVTVPREIQGQPPFSWKFGESSYKILSVGPIGVGGKIYLVIDHEIESWAEDKDAERKNRALIVTLGKIRPEYKSVFAGVVVRAHERGGTRGLGTVEENKEQSK